LIAVGRRFADLRLITGVARDAIFARGVFDGDHAPDLQVRGAGRGLRGGDQQLEGLRRERFGLERAHRVMRKHSVEDRASELERGQARFFVGVGVTCTQ
jgi:hypothetical protein